MSAQLFGGRSSIHDDECMKVHLFQKNLAAVCNSRSSKQSRSHFNPIFWNGLIFAFMNRWWCCCYSSSSFSFRIFTTAAVRFDSKEERKEACKLCRLDRGRSFKSKGKKERRMQPSQLLHLFNTWVVSLCQSRDIYTCFAKREKENWTFQIRGWEESVLCCCLWITSIARRPF